MLGRLLCKLGRHRRSRGRAVMTADGWVSRCRRCGVPMRRVAKGKWEVVRADPPA